MNKHYFPINFSKSIIVSAEVVKNKHTVNPSMGVRHRHPASERLNFSTPQLVSTCRTVAIKVFNFTQLMLTALLFLLPFSIASADASKQESGFGIALNTALNGEVLPFRLIATGLYYHGANQLELGFGFHPFIRKEQTITSADMNYKLFPNGRDKTLNLYMLANLSYINTELDTFYPTTYHYLFLHGGYGIELNGIKGSYMDTNVSFGGFTYKKDSKNPASSYLDADKFFKDFGSSINLQVSVGYRF